MYWPHFIKINSTLALAENEDTLVYWRSEKDSFNPEDIEKLALLNTEQLSKLIINIDIWRKLKPELKSHIKTVHLKQSQLMSLHKGDLEVGVRFIAACHDAVSLQYAQQIGCDAVFVSPVKVTETHPEVRALGWDRFADLIDKCQIPVFALGGES